MTGQIPEAELPDPDQDESIDQSADTSEDEGQTPDPQKEAPLTAEQYRQIAREEAIRAAQSLTAKSENRLTQQIQQQVAALKSAQPYSGMTDQQIQDAAQRIAVDALTGAGQFQQQPDLQETGMHPTIASAISMMEALGTIVEEGDPEFKTIAPILQSGDYTNLIRVTHQAVQAKAQRLQSRKEKAGARAPGGGGGAPTDHNDISNINDSESLYEQGEKRLRGSRR